MRIWQKIYLAALLLFLIMLNMGLFLAAKFIFSYNLQKEQKQGEMDCYFLCQNLEHDFSILQQNGRFQEELIDFIFEGYQIYYHTQNIEISLQKGENETVADFNSHASDGGGQMYISADQSLAEPYSLYHIQYRKHLVEFEEIWKSLKRMFAAISLTSSLLLCLILYILMRHMLKPLALLNDSVADIAAGRYGLQVSCKNKYAWNRDEISELSEHVNKMSETIRRQITELEDENAKKQQLMDNMAHELRTPLTSIYGYAEYLKYAKTQEEERFEGLTYIMEESRRLSKMSDTMLSMRLYEKNGYEPKPVNLQALADHVEKTLSAELKGKNLTLEKNFDADILYGEEELLANLFRNLLENAIHASFSGRKIIWNAYPTEEKLVFEVIDSGIGMTAEDLDHITEAFYRADKARSRKNGGAGLGLSIAAGIVEKMNGTLEFTSEPGKGTTVSINLQLHNKSIKSH